MIKKLNFILRHPLASVRSFNAALDHLMSNSLSLQSIELGSDKGPDGHGYTRAYLANFLPIRQGVRTFLEVGLLRDDDSRKNARSNKAAPSPAMWADFFPQATVFGFDICDFSGFKHPRCTIIQGDQSNRDDLNRLGIALGAGNSFEVIIDDGLHASPHQQITLGALFPLLSPGGLYCVEDLHYQPVEHERKGVPTTLSLLRQFQSTGVFESPLLAPEEAVALEQSIASVEFYDSLRSDIQGRPALAVIRKRFEPCP